jgi:hypothetical protein
MLTRDLIPTIYMRPLYLKADYMESFQPGLNFIPVSRAEISAQAEKYSTRGISPLKARHSIL